MFSFAQKWVAKALGLSAALPQTPAVKKTGLAGMKEKAMQQMGTGGIKKNLLLMGMSWKLYPLLAAHILAPGVVLTGVGTMALMMIMSPLVGLLFDGASLARKKTGTTVVQAWSSSAIS